MAKIIMDCCPCDQGHYGTTIYSCDECDKRLPESITCGDFCPKCGVKFDKIDFQVNFGFGGSDF